MENFIAKGQTVWVPKMEKFGMVEEVDHNGNITKVKMNGEIVDTTFTIVELWRLVSSIRKLLILLFAKK